MSLYDIVRQHRDLAWSGLDRFGEWMPEDVPDEGPPPGDVAAWWYFHGKAEAFAAVMSEIESAA